MENHSSAHALLPRDGGLDVYGLGAQWVWLHLMAREKRKSAEFINAVTTFLCQPFLPAAPVDTQFFCPPL